MRKSDLPQPLDRENWTAKELAAFLRTSLRKLHYMRAQSLLPEASRIGRSLVFRAAEIRAWQDAGCPPLEQWEAMKRTGGF
ncbi:MAG: helix-turn-helix domain-containing protein [Planctomycetota bacterium]|jgi:predicted DNA-binding transcriptional regulator AlpA